MNNIGVSQLSPVSLNIESSQDVALKKIWPRLRHKNPSIPLFFSAYDMRAWMNQPSNLLTLQSITNLCLSDLDLVELPDELKKITQLQNLELKHNSLTELPAWIEEFKELQGLMVAENKLSFLPESISELKKLILLNVCDNQLVALPSSIGELKELRVLILGANKLTTLPASIGELSSLSDLLISNNQLTELPWEIGQLTYLLVLRIDSNPDLHELPQSIQNIQLETLRCDEALAETISYPSKIVVSTPSQSMSLLAIYTSSTPMEVWGNLPHNEFINACMSYHQQQSAIEVENPAVENAGFSSEENSDEELGWDKFSDSEF